MDKIDYFFVVQQQGHSTKAKIVKVDSSNEEADLHKIASELKGRHPRSEIHYVRHPTDENIEVMHHFKENES